MTNKRRLTAYPKRCLTLWCTVNPPRHSILRVSQLIVITVLTIIFNFHPIFPIIDNNYYKFTIIIL